MTPIFPAASAHASIPTCWPRALAEDVGAPLRRLHAVVAWAMGGMISPNIFCYLLQKVAALFVAGAAASAERL